ETMMGMSLVAEAERALERIEEVPGVQLAGATVGPAFDGSSTYRVVGVGGGRLPVVTRYALGNYLQTLTGSRQVPQPSQMHGTVVVNGAFARLIARGGAPLSAVGTLIENGGSATVAGVVDDV